MIFFRDFIKNHVLAYLIHKYYGVYYSPIDGRDMVPGASKIKQVVMEDGSLFNLTEVSRCILEQCYSEYNTQDISPDDVVLDLGAHVGGITIQLAWKCRHVYSVEPIFYRELEENIRINHLDNITVIKGSLGNTNTRKAITFNGVTGVPVPVYTFEQILKICNDKITFLKCDCEGAEEHIPLFYFDNIPKIEIETHRYLKNPNLDKIYAHLKFTRECSFTLSSENEEVIHARSKKGIK